MAEHGRTSLPATAHHVHRPVRFLAGLTPSRRAGVTVLELAIAVGLVGLVMVNMTMLLRATSRSHDVTTDRLNLEVHASQLLDRMATALIGANADSVMPGNQAPLHASVIDYEISLGIQDGQVIWGDPERISLLPQTGEVVWMRSPDTSGERRVVWGRYVSEFMEGELLGNGIDDNDNGLVDEMGLSFTLEGDSVVIRLTLARPDSTGRLITFPTETRVAFRN